MSSIRRPILWLIGPVVLWLIGPLAVAIAAKDGLYTAGFDQPQPSWKVRFDRGHVQLKAHVRQTDSVHSGLRSERLSLIGGTSQSQVAIEHDLPPARVISELSVSVWLKCNQPGATVWLRILFPGQRDPRTGDVLSTWLKGDVYKQTGQWQRLRCQTSDRRVREEIQLLRRRLDNPAIKASGLYVDQVMLTTHVDRSIRELFLDELEFGPIVSPSRTEDVARSVAESDTSPVSFELGRLMVGGQPIFMRLLPDHAENIRVLRDSGTNVVWVPDWTKERRLQALRDEQMWAIAVPPQAVESESRVLDPERASLVPFARNTRSILGWYVGTRIPAANQDNLVSWAKQIRSADRLFQRPLLGDVTSGERVYSRHISMLGVSRHMLHTSFSFRQLREWLTRKRQSALPGTYVWSWIQTEASSKNLRSRKQAQRTPIVVEPEQIRLQVYAALAAGCRGVGYWKTSPLDAAEPGARERMLMISQLNMELRLLEDWLSTGRLMGHVPFTAQNTPGRASPLTSQTVGRTGTARDVAGRRGADLREVGDGQPESQLEAAMIGSARGLLLLPIYYQDGAQFVPGTMVARDATIVVPGVAETATAYQVTTTGIHSLVSERTTGGMKVILRHLDQTAAIILTSDHRQKQALQRRAAEMAETSARVSIALARAKKQRVQEVIQRLNASTVAPTDTPRMMYQTGLLLDRAERAMNRGDYDAARQLSNTTMQLLRMQQRAHWERTVWRFESPVVSPHTVCFQTLPDHWELLREIGNSSQVHDGNLLPSGDFEDLNQMLAAGWQHSQQALPGIHAGVELHSNAKQGRYSLRLFAQPVSETRLPKLISQPPVTVVSPPIEARAGQILHISGWVRVLAAGEGSLDGAMLYDSIAGPAGALRWRQRSGWKRFELIREVVQSGPVTLTFNLTGTGEIQLDDLQVIHHDGKPRTASSEPVKPAADSRRWPFIERFPGFGNALRRDSSQE